MTKEELRTKMKAVRNSNSLKDLLQQSNSIRNRLFKSEEYQGCRLLFSYLSFGSEADTWEIIKDALSGAFSERKRVFLPRVEGKQMNFYEVTELNSLRKSKFGILEPDDSHQKPFAMDGSECLMLLPGLAFDITGNRLGYGAGYYDRYLSEHGERSFHKLALAYDFQVLERIPAESFDIKADTIITPERTFHCNNERFEDKLK